MQALRDIKIKKVNVHELHKFPRIRFVKIRVITFGTAPLELTKELFNTYTSSLSVINFKLSVPF